MACHMAAPNPLCPGETGPGCWIEVTNQAGCYLWNSNPQFKETVTWSGCCVDCKASGKGETVWKHLEDGSRWITSTVEADFSDGYDYNIGTFAGPVHVVTVPAFKLGKYEVRFDHWDACVEDGGCRYRPDHENRRGHNPVINVSWNDTESFIRWLNNKTGGNYRLPTEAEWEYAARADTTTAHSWGNDIGSNRANCNKCGSRWDDDRAASVGSFPANPWGLHDMHGNVWEWVQDCWNDSYEGAPTDGSAWTSGNCRRRVVRGGSWYFTARHLRSAYRDRGDRSYRYHFIGFRLAQDK